MIVDQAAYVRSGDEAGAFVRSHPDTLVIPTHDKAVWESIEPVYE